MPHGTVEECDGTKEHRACWEVVEDCTGGRDPKQVQLCLSASGEMPLTCATTQLFPSIAWEASRWHVLKPCQGSYSQEKALGGHGSAPKPVPCSILFTRTDVGSLSISHSKVCCLLLLGLLATCCTIPDFGVSVVIERRQEKGEGFVLS